MGREKIHRKTKLKPINLHGNSTRGNVITCLFSLHYFVKYRWLWVSFIPRCILGTKTIQFHGYYQIKALGINIKCCVAVNDTFSITYYVNEGS